MAGRVMLMFPAAAQAIEALLRIEAFKEFPDLGMADRLAGFVIEQVLLGNISYILCIVVLCEQMVEGLVLAGTDVFWDRQPPFLGIVEDRVDIEDHAAKR